MDDEKKQELSDAYSTLTMYNLWRRGKTDRQAGSREIGEAIDAASGAILDFIECDIRLSICETSLCSAEKALEKSNNELEQQENISVSTKNLLDEARREIRRLKSILAAHRIKYSGEK